MEKDLLKEKAREQWLKVYEKTGSISKAARKCGIARSTLQRWLKRYKIEGLSDRSRCPRHLARKKWEADLENLVLDIRDNSPYGKLRICSHLFNHYQIKVSASTVGRILNKYEKGPLKRYSKQRAFIRYAKGIPGERVQLDVCQIDKGIYQYTAIDDCTRFRVLYTYSRRTAKNSMDFLERMVEQMPFPVQRVQTDRGKEFFAYCFQEKLREYCIKFRPIKPRSPHLNGKVERSHQTDLQEFYLLADLKDPQLNDRLEEWQFHYNWYRPHSSLKGKTPMHIVVEKSAITPFGEDVEAKYDPNKEPILEQHYRKQRKLTRYLKTTDPSNPLLNATF